MSDSGVSQGKIKQQKRLVNDAAGVGGSSLVSSVLVVIMRSLLVKPGLPNFVSIAFFCFINYCFFKKKKKEISYSIINIYKHMDLYTIVCVANITHARKNKRKQQLKK